MSVPVKYREIGDFHRYYSGELVAPYLTIFAGGNHEASNHLWELYYGGWVAPNIYYLGAANVIRLGPLRIASMSGIWKGYDYRKPHWERLPYNSSAVGSAYHIREVDVRKLLQLQTQVDVGLSHDWPQGIEWKGNYKWLFQKKDLFQADAESGRLGSVAAAQAMNWLRPPHWFSAHMHIRYEAQIDWNKINEKSSIEPKVDIPELSSKVNAAKLNTDEIDLDMDEDDPPTLAPAAPATGNNDEIDLDLTPPPETASVPEQLLAPVAPIPNEALRAKLPASFQKSQRPERKPALTEEVETPEAIKNRHTNFLSLDKCLPNRRFLEMVEIEPISENNLEKHQLSRPFQFMYDREWLAITKAMASELVLGPANAQADPSIQTPPAKSSDEYALEVAKASLWVDLNVDNFTIPANFELTAPVYDGNPHTNERPREYNNPQTAAYCDMLGIENQFLATEEEWQTRLALGALPEPERFGGGRGRGRGRGHGGRGGRGRGRGNRY
jgi:lariat debranching enzyme